MKDASESEIQRQTKLKRVSRPRDARIGDSRADRVRRGRFPAAGVLRGSVMMTIRARRGKHKTFLLASQGVGPGGTKMLKRSSYREARREMAERVRQRLTLEIARYDGSKASRDLISRGLESAEHFGLKLRPFLDAFAKKVPGKDMVKIRAA